MTEPPACASWHAVAAALARALEAAGTPERAVKDTAYHKSSIAHLGVPLPRIRSLVREHAGRLDTAAALDVAERLWAEPVWDRRMAAVVLLERSARRLDPAALPHVERMLRESGGWALVDGLATGVAGVIADRHPDAAAELDRWAIDEDFWLRRAAMLALLPGLRRGEGDFARFGRYADAMLEEREFFIRKAIGWVLREVATRRPELVVEWLEPRIGRASGVTVREAVRRLPAPERERLLAAYRAGGRSHGVARRRGR